MATLVTRAVKGEPLTHAEVDANFNNLNTEIGTNFTDLDTRKLESVQGIFITGARTVTEDYTILGTENVMSPGPITIADTITVTIADGGEWVVV